MIEMVQCKICKRVFETTCSIDLCPSCKKKDDDIYTRLRNYLIENPGAKIFEVSAVLSIPVHYIKRYLREERLQIMEKENNFLKCEKCGRPICSGILCDKCFNLSHEKSPIFNTTHYQSSLERDDILDNPFKKDASNRINYVSSRRSRRRRASV